MKQYSSDILYQFADKLYRQANRMIFTSAVTGCLIGGILGYLIPHILVRIGSFPGKPGLFLLIGLLIGGSMGYSNGVRKAFNLKFQAQIILCLIKLEENTRNLLPK